MSGELLAEVLGIALVAAAAAFALLPLARGSSEKAVAPDSETLDRTVVYRQVLELEFDLQLGKLSKHDFDQLSAQLLAQAGQALREERGALATIDDEIEREIAAARAAFAAARRATQPETVS